MFQHQQQRRQHRQFAQGKSVTAVVVLTGFALGTGLGPAAARQDAGTTAAHVGHANECLLERVGTQYVRCDDNTGNGVPAPTWVSER